MQKTQSTSPAVDALTRKIVNLEARKSLLVEHIRKGLKSVENEVVKGNFATAKIQSDEVSNHLCNVEFHDTQIVDARQELRKVQTKERRVAEVTKQIVEGNF